MRLGLHVGYWGLGLTSEQQLELVKEAESVGFDSVWAAEAYGSDTATVLAWIAGQTEKIRLGSAIFQMPGRTPAMTAMTAATLDQLSDGRMILGIGSSGPQVAEGWHGQPFAHQLQRTREYVEILRKALARERLEYDGEHLQLPLPDGPGKALKLMIGTVQERLPIYIAAIGPKNTTLTGEIADGWMPTFFSPEHVGDARELLSRGRRRRRARRWTSFDIAPMVNVAIDDDLDRARDVMRPILALYIGGMGSRDKNFYNALVRRYGFEDAADEVQDLYLDGKKDEAAAALPAELIDMTSICGPRDRVEGAARRLPRRGRRHADDHADGLRPRGAQADRARARGAGLSDAASGALPPRRLRGPGARLPRDRAGRASWPRRGHAVCLQTWDRWREHVEARGHAVRAGARVQGLPAARRAAAEALRGRGAGAEDTQPLIDELDPDAVVVGHPHRGRRRWPPSWRGGRWATLVPHVLPITEPGLPPYSDRAPGCRAPGWARGCGPLPQPLLRGGEDRGRRELNGARERVGPAAARPLARRHLARAGADRHLPPARVPAHRLGALDAGDAARCCGSSPTTRSSSPPGDDPLVLVAP